MLLDDMERQARPVDLQASFSALLPAQASPLAVSRSSPVTRCC
jgi:hypothetical protein